MSEVTSTTDTSAPESTENASIEGAQETQGESQSQEQKQAIAALKEKFKLTVDGEDFEEEVDWNDKEGLKKKLQLAHAAQKRMAEAKTAKSKAFEIIKAFEEDPGNVFKRLGPKGREAAEKFLLEQIKEDMLDPKDKELRDLKLYKEQTEAEKTKAKEEREKAARAEQEARYAQDYQNTIITALDKSGLPKTPEMVKRMAGIMAKNLELGLELTSDDLVQEVKGDITSIIKSILKDADGDHLLNLFGDDIANKIRKSDLKKLQEKQNQIFQKPTSKVSTPQSSKQDRPMSIEEWKKQVEERLK